MTEYDYSPEAYERYLETQRRISRWVDDTNSHSSEFRSPFETRADISTSKESPLPRARPRANEVSSLAGGTRSGEGTTTSRNSVSHAPNYDPGGTRGIGTTTYPTQRRSSSHAPSSHRHTYPYAVQAQAQAVPMTAGAVTPAAAGPVYAIKSQRRSQSHSPRPQSSHSHTHRHDDDSRSRSHQPHHSSRSHSSSQHRSSSQHHSRSHGQTTPTRSTTLPAYYVSTKPHTSQSHHSSAHKSHRSRSHSTPRTSSKYIIQPGYTSGVTTPSNSPTYVVTQSHGKPAVVSAPVYGGYTIIPPKGKTMKVIYP